MESFGKQLRTLREKRHLTVNQLATYSGVSAAGISRIENGKRGVPKPATIKKLADALKIPYEELMQTAGYIETVQETGVSYDTGCTLLEKAETYELHDLSLLERENWRHLSKEDLVLLDKYFAFLSAEAKKRTNEDS
ncbi:helix-turn-helix transcriptional regulator [Bacillus sp. L381]|uniref:Transcriptional repressor RghR RapGH repressor n=2 Tax=Bacillus amyloliquefaciens TaxID=1390 RepID=A0A9P1NIS3_BACAS|nr:MULTISPECIES: helix-turn-helix transcriptional regulator [Bacillus]AIW35220.1 XRE family transcriptional regulator [Bacillus subtilis]AEB25572.1 Transcriptional repressor RghR RapGH repressor [Bacillus amyloliquefaciens TA208]AEB65031.1 Transcriptional repressor RghR RapGH repressor [Bacillus amyloliquefaciens LL3]AEK90605.1 putative transcriptional regulator [Bacillus amyloliquefaciens XH7]AOC92472.1 HTH-type transcriptional repressor RghR [Bacillus amyloliquefaciens]